MRRGRNAARLAGGVLMAAACIGFSGSTASAQQSAIECGSFYRVQAGDTLRGITVRTYPHDRYAVVFGANRDILANPAQIEVGQLLFLPCTGAGPQSRTQALAAGNIQPTLQDQRGTRAAGGTASGAQTVPQVALAEVDTLPKSTSRGRRPGLAETTDESGAASVAVITPGNTQRRGDRVSTYALVNEPVLMLSASGLEPLAGPELEAGGLVGALIQEALRQGGAGNDARAVFVNDRQAHLDVLLPLEAFGLGYPWPAPNCAKPSGRHSRAFCDAFEASLPIYQIELRMLARADDPITNLTEAASLSDKAFCRPQDFPPFDLEKQNVRRIITAENLDACLEVLEAGSVDLISVPAMMMSDILLGAGVVEIEALRRQEPVHAVFSRNSNRADALRKSLNTGLQRLQNSGEWFRIVSGYLRRFNAGLPAARG